MELSGPSRESLSWYFALWCEDKNETLCNVQNTWIIFSFHSISTWDWIFCVQEAILKKKDGGLMPKKPPLISKVWIDQSKFQFKLWISTPADGILHIGVTVGPFYPWLSPMGTRSMFNKFRSLELCYICLWLKMFLCVSQYLLQSVFPRTLVLIFILLFWDQDHERAFFDSADWALGKVSKSPPNALFIHPAFKLTSMQNLKWD